VKRIALVTGAGSGIGRAIAIELAACGYTCALVGRREAALRETRELLRAADHLIIARDIATSEGSRGAVRACVEQCGALDVLVCNAGLGVVCPLAQTTDELLSRTYAINAFSPAWMTLEAWPVFARQFAQDDRRACVVHVSSMASLDPFPGFFAYAGSKAAMSIMAASTAKEGASIGVRAFALAPGAVETDMLRAAFDESVLPREQALAPAHVARVVARCVQGELDTLNGRTIPVLPDTFKAWYETWRREHAHADAM
jgi:NAD(P)-dependent dehydrogenase (short-subunit alcohol dehydrogenase family)